MKNKVTLAISTLVLCSSVSVAQAAKHQTLSKTNNKHSTASTHKAEHNASFSHHHATHTHHTLASHHHHYEPENYSSSDDSHVGTATFYSTRFHGRPTASGEPYDMNELTAAHRSLPLHSYVEVTNLENNRKVVVKINDRGPFHSHHVMDLSTAAAEELGMGGIGKVKITPVAMNEYAENN
jgi:rare lipoprotein A